MRLRTVARSPFPLTEKFLGQGNAELIVNAVLDAIASHVSDPTLKMIVATLRYAADSAVDSGALDAALTEIEALLAAKKE